MECALSLQIIAGAKLYNVQINHPALGWMNATDRPIPRHEAIQIMEKIKKWKIKQAQKKPSVRLAG